MTVKDIEKKININTDFAIFNESDEQMETPLFVSDKGLFETYKKLKDREVKAIGNYDWDSEAGIAIFI